VWFVLLSFTFRVNPASAEALAVARRPKEASRVNPPVSRGLSPFFTQARDPTLFKRCHELLAAQCSAPDPSDTKGGLVATKGPAADTKGGLSFFGLLEPALAGELCSGRGSCVTDWRKCGAGTATNTATPCCYCDVGFAG